MHADTETLNLQKNTSFPSTKDQVMGKKKTRHWIVIAVSVPRRSTYNYLQLYIVMYMAQVSIPISIDPDRQIGHENLVTCKTLD